jgi:hypothetical protein
MRFVMTLLLVSLALASCKNAPAPLKTASAEHPSEYESPDPELRWPQADSPYVTIWVSRAGAIELNGKLADLDAVDKALTRLEKENGAVVYGREMPKLDPNPTVLQVLKIVVEKQLPIRLSVRRDFTDAVGPEGRITE